MARKGQSTDVSTGWQAGFGDEDFLRGLVQRTVQQVLEAETTSFLGAETYERNGRRRCPRPATDMAGRLFAKEFVVQDGAVILPRGMLKRRSRAAPEYADGRIAFQTAA
jgi:hypothetical protein